MRCIPAGSGLRLAILVSAALLTAPASAQPFDAWLLSTPGTPTTHGYLQIPHHAALNPTGGFTFEAWIFLTAPGGAGSCVSFAGKGYTETWWIGACQGASNWIVRTYLKGQPSGFDGGVLPVGQWTHLAITFDGATRRHYINGEQVASQALAGPLTTNAQPVRIFSDVHWNVSPRGSIDEARLWNVARTQAQIRAALNVRITAAQAGLVAVWPLNGNGNDLLGPHDGGALQGTGVNYFIAAVASDCGEQTATALCLNDRFQITARYRTGAPGTADSPAMTIPCSGAICEGSGIFWFFQDTNWELMVKSLNACALNDYWWLFTAGLTNVHFRLEVTDVTKGETKIYFNYPGPPAPAITDTSAFATCP
jgi:Concanavalin A-like lectin/glucanases superfamily